MYRCVVLALLDGAALVAARSGIADSRRLLCGRPMTSVDDAAATVCVAVIELVALWLAVGLVAGLASAVPGAVGAGARQVAVWMLPRVVRHLLAGAVGVGVVAAPVAAGARVPVPASPVGASGSVAFGAGPLASDSAPIRLLPAPGWPTDDPLPSPRWPVSGPEPPSRSASVPVPRPQGARVQVRQVRVRRGDSLWALAARALPGTPTPARVAAAWPRWWAANRSVIGADPNLLRPGEVLTVPTSAAKEA